MLKEVFLAEGKYEAKSDLKELMKSIGKINIWVNSKVIFPGGGHGSHSSTRAWSIPVGREPGLQSWPG